MAIRLLTILLASALIAPVHSAAVAERGKDTKTRVEVSSTQRIVSSSIKRRGQA